MYDIVVIVIVRFTSNNKGSVDPCADGAWLNEPTN